MGGWVFGKQRWNQVGGLHTSRRGIGYPRSTGRPPGPGKVGAPSLNFWDGIGRDGTDSNTVVVLFYISLPLLRLVCGFLGFWKNCLPPNPTQPKTDRRQTPGKPRSRPRCHRCFIFPRIAFPRYNSMIYVICSVEYLTYITRSSLAV